MRLLGVLLLLSACAGLKEPLLPVASPAALVAVSAAEPGLTASLRPPLLASPKSATNLDSLWDACIHTMGCLTGGQYSRNGKFGNEGNVMDRSKTWKTLLEQPRGALTRFLVGRMGSTDTTEVHTCPFYGANEGELAVYALQRMHGINWYDFPEFSSYKDREITSAEDSPQSWLQAILRDRKQCAVMKKLWLGRLE